MSETSIELLLPVQREYQAEVIKNIYWVDPQISSARYHSDDDTVIHIHYDGKTLPEGTVHEIKNTAARIVSSLDRAPIECVFDQSDVALIFTQDPLPLLEKQGLVKVLFPGGYAYSGLFLNLMTGLDRTFRELALDLGCDSYRFPNLFSYRSARRCQYLNSYPQNVNLVSHVHEDLCSLRRYRESLVEDDERQPTKYFDPPDLILSPTICYHFWQSLADRELASSKLQVGTAAGQCHRFESRATTGIERLREFTMREIFAIGQKSDVVALREKLLATQVELLQRFQIAARIETASDPFFVDTSDKRTYQLGLNLKHEVKALLPYKNEFLAIGSVNYHESFFSKVFDIQSKEQNQLHSCCLGFGLDRWCLVIFAQFGLQPERWPETLRKLV